MNAIDAVLTSLHSTVAQHIGWMLVHSLWQLALLAGIYLIVRQVLQRRSASVRYLAACVTVSAMVLALPLTAFYVDVHPSTAVAELRSEENIFAAIPRASESARSEPAAEIDSPLLAAPAADAEPAFPQVISTAPVAKEGFTIAGWKEGIRDRLVPTFPWIVALWLVGVGVLAVRQLGGWLTVRHLCGIGTEAVGDELLKRLHGVANRLGVERTVRLLASSRVDVPAVIGHFRPVILLPVGLLSGLTIEEIELILAHELAHIRRHDYLINLVQTTFETLLFYHPAAWWLSSEIRRERENCCDDLAVSISGNRIAYARTLAMLEEKRTSMPATAIAASGGSLIARIRRVVGQPAKTNSPRGTWLAGALVMLSVCVILPIAMATGGGESAASDSLDGTHSDQNKPQRESTIASVQEQDQDTVKTPQPVVAMTGEPTFTLPDHRTVRALRFSPDGKSLASVSRDEGRYLIRTWDVVKKQLIREVTLDWDENWNRSADTTMMLSNDGTKVVASLGGEIGLFDAGTGKMVKRLKPPAELQKDASLGHLRCLPNMSRIACVRTLNYIGGLLQDAHLIVWDVNTQHVMQVIELKHQGYNIRSLAFSMDGKWLATGSGNQTSVWDVSRGELLLKIPNSNPHRKHPDIVVKDSTLKMVLSVEFSPNRKLLAIGDLLGVKLVDASSGHLVHRIDAPFRYGFGKFVFSPDSQLLARLDTDMTLGTPDTVPIWSTKTGQLITALATDANDGTFSHDGKWFAIGLSDRKEAIRLFTIDEGIDTSEQIDQSRLIISKARHGQVLPDGISYSLNGKQIRFGQLQELLKAKLNKSPNLNLLIVADKELPLSTIAIAAQAAEMAGVQNIEAKRAGNRVAKMREWSVVSGGKVDSAMEGSGEEPVVERTEVPIKTTIRGTVVDDATGQPIGPITVQGGKFNLDNPSEVTWGYTESRSSRKNGQFRATVRWPEGWTARIIADGYIPQPVLTKAPLPGQDVIELVIRLKRGKLVKGRVLDHEGEPVQGAAVFAIGPTGLNLAGGKAWDSEDENRRAKPVYTDEAGRFELHAGDATRLAVSCTTLDAWPLKIPKDGDAIVRLPAPATFRIQYNIEGADAEAVIGYQLLNHVMPGFKGLESMHSHAIKNGGQLDLTAMTPCKYQIWRQQRHRIGEFGTGAMLDRQFFEIRPGETKTIRFVREKGSPLRGKVTGPEGTKLSGVVVSINSLDRWKDPFDGHQWDTTFASTKAATDGSFTTERIAPGRYLLTAEGYVPLTPQQRYSTGLITPTYTAQMTIDVPESGEVTVPDLKLSKANFGATGKAEGQ